MLKTIEVVFDGTNFVPTGPVELPAGTKVMLSLPANHGSGSTPPPLTEKQKQDWERLSKVWAETPPPFPTLEEAMAYSRGRPWPELLSPGEMAPTPGEAP